MLVKKKILLPKESQPMLLSKALKPGETLKPGRFLMPPAVARMACSITREKSNCCGASSLIISFLINTITQPSSENCVILGTLGSFIIGIYGLWSVFDVIYCNELYFHPTFISVVFSNVFLFLHHFQEERRKSSPL